MTSARYLSLTRPLTKRVKHLSGSPHLLDQVEAGIDLTLRKKPRRYCVYSEKALMVGSQSVVKQPTFDRSH